METPSDSTWPLRYLVAALARARNLSTASKAELARDPELVESLRRGRVPPGTPASVAESLRALDWEACRREDEAQEGLGARILALGEACYPEALAEIPDPPPALYLRGEGGTLLRPCVALVGSRLSTTYGQNVARMLGEDLARAGVTVVSGLARGIDAHAHRGSLGVPGRAAAVLATGIDEIYPREHEGLALEICGSGGALLAEAPPGTPPRPHLFPVRNRILAGLCWATVVVEAAERSGSLITARLALEYGREVFAVPHNITTRIGVGPNTLIQKGARLVQRAADIVEEMPAHVRERLAGTGPDALETAELALSPDARSLLEALSPDQPRGVDALSAATGFSAPRVLSLLLELSMANLCTECPGMRYARRLAGRG